MPVTDDDKAAELAIAIAINDAICDANDLDKATESRSLTSCIVASPKVRALIPALAQFDQHNREEQPPMSERYPILDAVQKILRIAERINHHNVDVAQNIARGLGDTNGLSHELDEAFQEYYECFKQT